MTVASSLDQDMRKLRMSRYTPSAEKETREWIERTLGENLPAGDLISALKDGTVLCRLINHASPATPIRFKKSNLPFVQMENISQFLRAVEDPPFHLPGHDRFLTVDLFESKDPAQVLQCLSAFSRVANALDPRKISNTIGPQSELVRTATLLSNGTKGAAGLNRYGTVGRRNFAVDNASGAMSPNVTGSSRGGEPSRPSSSLGSWGAGVSTGGNIPAWNYIQYGSMHGANQGNQGLVFGGRRQIVDDSPSKASTFGTSPRKKRETEDEIRRRTRNEQLEEEERRVEEEENRRRDELEKLRQGEFDKLERQKREWERQEQEWTAREQARLQEEREAEKKYDQERERRRKDGSNSPGKINQQDSQQQQHQRHKSLTRSSADEGSRIADLERQLAEAKERERLYQLEREHRRGLGHSSVSSSVCSFRSRSSSRTERRAQREPSPKASEVSWAAGEENLHTRTHSSPFTLPPTQQAAAPHQAIYTTKSTNSLPGNHSILGSPQMKARPLPDPLSSPSTPRPRSSTMSRRPISGPSTPITAAAITPRPLPRPGVSASKSPALPPQPDSPPSPPIHQAPVTRAISTRPLPKPTIRKSSQTVKTDLFSPQARHGINPVDQDLTPVPAPITVPPPVVDQPAALPSPTRNQPLPPRPSSSLLGSRPLPRPAFGSVRRSPFGRMSPEKASNVFNMQPPPASSQSGNRVPSVHLSREMQLSSAAEQDNEAEIRRVAQQKANMASTSTSKSLLEREMERERQRLSEWEEEQNRKGQTSGISVSGGRAPLSPTKSGGGVIQSLSPSRSPSRATGVRGPSPFARALVGPRPGP